MTDQGSWIGQHCQGRKDTTAGPKSAEGGLGESKRKGLGRKGKGTASPPPPYLGVPPLSLPFPTWVSSIGAWTPFLQYLCLLPHVSLVWGFYM